MWPEGEAALVEIVAAINPCDDLIAVGITNREAVDRGDDQAGTAVDEVEVDVALVRVVEPRIADIPVDNDVLVGGKAAIGGERVVVGIKLAAVGIEIVARPVVAKRKARESSRADRGVGTDGEAPAVIVVACLESGCVAFAGLIACREETR